MCKLLKNVVSLLIKSYKIPVKIQRTLNLDPERVELWWFDKFFLYSIKISITVGPGLQSTI